MSIVKIKDDEDYFLYKIVKEDISKDFSGFDIYLYYTSNFIRKASVVPYSVEGMVSITGEVLFKLAKNYSEDESSFRMPDFWKADYVKEGFLIKKEVIRYDHTSDFLSHNISIIINREKIEYIR